MNKEEIELIKAGKHPRYLWRPKSIVWKTPKKK